MKKFYSLILVVLTLLSCVVFSACGDKYEKLSMSFCSSDGNALTSVELVIDVNNQSSSKRVGIKFSGIDEKDIGQVVVYSLPNELITVSNYIYSNDMCYVDITPNMPSGNNAKLVVSHLSSGKKADIDLKIDKKSNNISLLNSNYVVSIPEQGVHEHYFNTSSVVQLLPAGSTDKIYFKLTQWSDFPDFVEFISCDIEGVEGVFEGFIVDSNIVIFQGMEISMYPVTYLETSEGVEVKEYPNQKINIYFEKTLNENNVSICLANDSGNNGLKQLANNELQLIANDLVFNSEQLTLAIKRNNQLYALADAGYLNRYKISLYSADDKKVYAFVDGNNKVIINVNAHTDEFVEISVVLTPINCVGDIYPVTKIVKVKAQTRPDSIQVKKDGQIISLDEKINIFDYYSEGNSLGSLFNFKPIANNGANVHEDLKTMRIVISADVLHCVDENSDGFYENILGTMPNRDKKMYTLVFHKFDSYLNFTYDEDLTNKLGTGESIMVSEPITELDRIYIKHEYEEDVTVESAKFGFEVETLAKGIWENKDISASITVNCNRIDGVKSMMLEAGQYVPGIGVEEYQHIGDINKGYIYLNRQQGVDKLSEPGMYFKYISAKNGSVLGIDNAEISTTEFEVVLSYEGEKENPLQIYNGTVSASIANTVVGVNKFIYTFKNTPSTDDIVGLIFKENTTVGEYQITFYQEGIEKASVICKVYESLHALNETNVNFETNLEAFKNIDYTDTYSSQYIVSAGQDLSISLDLTDDILNSNIIAGYNFNFEIVDNDGNLIDSIDDKTIYFNVKHDDSLFNSALLQFRKGTYIGKIAYIKLTITAKSIVYADMVTQSDTLAEESIPVTFFIYNKIDNKDISINYNNVKRYFSEYLGIYNKEEAKAHIEVNMTEDLWNYVTGEHKVEWQIDSAVGLIWQGNGVGYNTNDTFCNLEFESVGGDTSYTRTLKAYITQFNDIFELQCVFNVEKPIISERLIIKSEVGVNNSTQDYYINLKKGESYTVVADNYSKLGEVTHKGIIVQMADETGSAYNAKDYFDVNQDVSKITVKKVDNQHKFKLIVFAKDALKIMATTGVSGYNYPPSYLIDGIGVEEGIYKNAYFVLNIELSDGSENNPYLIETANDFYEIDDSDVLRESYYKLMTSISLKDATDKNSKIIENFAGNIKSDDNSIYTIEGITLNSGCKNLFSNFSGNISNIIFEVDFDYNYHVNNNSTILLGLFDINYGNITNVQLRSDGQAILNGSATYSFGCLVGENRANITYTQGLGVSGNVELNSNDAKIYFGGLVGTNIGCIEGCEPVAVSSSNKIILSGSDRRSNALSSISIIVNVGSNSAIGGVIGLNTYNLDIATIGTIKNAFVQANIIGETTSNIGGVIGKNLQEANSLTVKVESENLKEITNVLDGNTYIDKSIYNVKSASIIKAYNNVGGIVGVDLNGLYIECDYQVLPTTNKTYSLEANNVVGGIAGISDSGKFLYCSVMSYNWNYKLLKETDKSTVFNNVADISGFDYVGGIVGLAVNTASNQILSPGEQEVNNKVIVAYSSVNAYLQATKDYQGELTGNIGGILSSNSNYMSIIYNAYFIGKLDGNVNYKTEITSNGGETKTHYLCLDNNGSSIYNVVYSINLVLEESAYKLKIGHVKDGEELTIETNPGLDHWWHNSNINGGYIFITKDNTLPIFDLTPESIKVSVKDEIQLGLKQTLRVNYYDFSINENIDDATLLLLNEMYNKNQYIYRKPGERLLNIEVQPSNIGAVVLNVKSTNSRVVDVTFDGRLIINGVGECELVFSSVLNPNAGNINDRTIKVIVDYPIGDEFNISTSKTDESKIIKNSDTENISKDSSKQYYVITKGAIEYDYNNDGNIENYSYKTKDNVNLQVVVSYATTDANFKISDYVLLSGVGGTEENTSGVSSVIYEINNKTPFMISVLKYLESNDAFNVSIVPFNVINNTIVPYEKSTEFKLSTKLGATNVAFSYDDAVVYPNDTVYLTVNLTTDNPLCYNNGIVNVEDVQTYIDELLNGIVKTEIGLILHKTSNKVDYNLFVDSAFYNDNTQIQTIVFRFEFTDMKLTTEEYLNVELSTLNGNTAEVSYTIIPQRINKIEIKNYYKDGEEVLANVLKPNNPGRMIIDIVPENGYYDYLEISDITGNEEILFIQLNTNGEAISTTYDPSSDKKGIKLYKDESGIPSRLFVRTQIDRNYSSKPHTVQVRAYSALGVLLASFSKVIDVKMLPEVTASYVLPSGEDGFTVATSQQNETYLAIGVDANFRIETKNSNSDLEVEILGDLSSKYAFEHIVGNHYVLRRTDKNMDSNDIGKKVRVVFRTYYYENSDYEVAECSVEFTVVEFVIHSVSINSSIDNLNTKEIYGYLDKPIELEFYFDKDDISYYDQTTENEYFWDTVYSYSQGIEEEYEEGSPLYEIYSVLKELNNNSSNDYLILNNNNKDLSDGSYITNGVDFSKIILANNNLKVEEGYNKKVETQNGVEKEIEDPKYLAILFKLAYSDTYGWQIKQYSEDISIYQYKYDIDKNYKLNFKRATSWYEPTVIKDETDFLNMSSGERYILANDLVLENYVPIDADIVEFDGNGRTITIRSFGIFDEEEIKAGLFKQIYTNMVVKNVVVKYESINSTGNWTFGKVNNNEIIYTDLCNNPNVNYTRISFGGITAVNNGIITNCYVEGTIAINASTVEQKKFASGANYEINFFIGGMVAENASTGYITNSTTKLNVFSQANIGGFAYSNAGKIVSSGVEDVAIYSYNTMLEKTIVVKIAGFVVENTKEISMCYVSLTKGALLTNNVYAGTMSAKDISAGFVYTNSGNIYDAYVQIDATGINNNTFSGFVYQNSGKVTRAYTFINNGSRVDNNDSMFAPGGSTGFVNCIEIVVEKAGYNNGIAEGLKVVYASQRYNKTYYEQQGFAFGDNESAVWSMNANSLPKLVSTQEKVVYTGSNAYDGLMPFYTEKITENDVEKITYKPNYAYYGTKDNPYIITGAESWTNYFTNNSIAYYRIVKDIDFSVFGDNPPTSTTTFKGNIQGNNMILSNIMLYSTSSLDALGLFKDMASANDKNVKNSIRNLTLTTTSVWASKTNAVGLLAGIVEDFNLYNININAEGVIMVGGNVVGGLAGIVRGVFDIDQISSNIGVNSTRASTLTNYSIYMSTNNQKSKSYNLSQVYYAGSVVGVLDGYSKNLFKVNDDRVLNEKRYSVKNIVVTGNVTIIGDSVGGAFGLVGEMVSVKHVTVNISGALSGAQYSAGVAGENRGAIENAKVILADNIFAQSSKVSAGAVGFNLAGLIRNVEVKANINKTQYAHVIGGIVGRNIYGTINNTLFDGELFAFYTGGIVGANYSSNLLIQLATGTGSITLECRSNTFLIPKNVVVYKENGHTINNFKNVALSLNTLNYMMENSNKFYVYKEDSDSSSDLNAITVKNKVLGMIVGLNYTNSFDNITACINENAVVFNNTSGINAIKDLQTNTSVVLQQGLSEFEFVANTKVVEYAKLTKAYVMYLSGARVALFDSWNRNEYSDEYVVFLTIASE